MVSSTNHNFSFEATSAGSTFTLTPLSDRKPFPLYFIPLYYVFMILSLLPSPTAARSWAASSLTVCYLAYVLTLTNGGFAADFPIYCIVAGQVFQHVSLMHWVVPESKYLPKNSRADLHNTWEKLRWATALVFSPRGLGWTQEVKCISPQQQRVANLSRGEYLISRTIKLVYYLAIIDVQTAWRNVVFKSWTVENPTGVTDLPWKTQIMVTWSHAIFGFAGISAAYTAIAILCVGLGFSKPVDFPGLFGQWKDAYTVRRLWGEVWHQNLRIIFTSASSTLLSAMRISPRTFASRYIQLFTAFVLSALMHELAAVLSCRADCGELYFFISQAFAIFVEDHVIDFGKTLLGYKTSDTNTGKTAGAANNNSAQNSDNRSSRQMEAPKWYWRAIGFVWGFVWFSYSIRLYVDREVRQGLYVPQPGQGQLSARWIK
ncbi:hypothetical protein K461DRAFT_276452 [Myriangium duriaei CBS 260.36]|uniref:Wax synthase domain-containing protein n=1 Tax=Myriangium duriaei CBS 260.36 TaxID=1168546 RepID=A0A9P4J4G9_9PEZI|nr:hypothetical protein K461DRAFT_276452 [Myriangium duriaei CBS 260.36]